jgi:putative oxidoreductase
MRNALGLAGRILIAALFLGGAAQKFGDAAPAQALLAMRGLPDWLVWPALAFNLAAGLALLAGLWLERVALALAAYCGLTSLFHLQPDDPWQMTIFVKNWAIAGGLLCLAAGGGGAWRYPRR